MNDGWKEAFTDRAREHWTAERQDELLGGKDLPITPTRAPTLLRAIGLLRHDATMPGPERRKFFQLNHMVRLMRPALAELAESGPVHVVDAGCGRSYLTLALAWWFLDEYGDGSARILGIDRKSKVLDDCQRRAEMAGLADVVRFEARDLQTVSLDEVVDAVIGLHACDTATDDAIRLGLRHDARLIAVAPCCQAELAARWTTLSDEGASGGFAEIWHTPHLRREVAASITDAFRKLLLEAAGFETRAIEFVAPEHTPKNTLVRAMKRGPHDAQARDRYLALREHTGGVGIALEAYFGF